MIPGDRHRAGRGRRRDRHDRPDRVGPGQRHLERDHAAERATDDEIESLEPEGVEQPPLRPRLVACRDRREGGPYGRPVRGSTEVGPVVPYRPPSRLAATTPMRCVSSARPGPMSGAHQSPAASADPVRAWMTSTCGASAGGGPSCR